MLRYSWRLAYFANISLGSLLLISAVVECIKDKYRLSGFIGDLLVPNVLRIRGGISNTILEGVLKGAKPSLPFVLSALLLSRRQGWIRMLGVSLSSAYSGWLWMTGKHRTTNLSSFVMNIVYLLVRSWYRVPLSDLRGAIRKGIVLLSPRSALAMPRPIEECL